jgi:hypothetical protein
MKICRTCGEPKELTAYYIHKQMADGHLNICIDCTKKRVAKDRYDNPDKLSERDKCRYKKDSDRKESCCESSKKSRIKFPKKYKARNKVNNAIRDGRLFKQPCSECGNAEVEAHHLDYDKPLDVVWLCSKHHGEQSRKYENQQI